MKKLRVESPLTPALDRLVYEIIGIGLEVHSALGPGLRERVYEDAFAIALAERSLGFVRQAVYRFTFKSRPLAPVRLDLVVAEQVIVEIKAVAALHDVHSAQMLTYLKWTKLPVGLIFNFNVCHLRDGIRRHIGMQPR